MVIAHIYLLLNTHISIIKDTIHNFASSALSCIQVYIPVSPFEHVKNSLNTEFSLHNGILDSCMYLIYITHLCVCNIFFRIT